VRCLLPIRNPASRRCWRCRSTPDRDLALENANEYRD
jgi:hypothetical protein